DPGTSTRHPATTSANTTSSVRTEQNTEAEQTSQVKSQALGDQKLRLPRILHAIRREHRPRPAAVPPPRGLEDFNLMTPLTPYFGYVMFPTLPTRVVSSVTSTRDADVFCARAASSRATPAGDVTAGTPAVG